ncbi:MAG: fumarylacetoacetate hydrolase family protein [Alphaproteobacteria bacterium]
MKLVTFVTREPPSEPRVGVLVKDTVIDLAAAHRALAGDKAPPLPSTVKALIAAGADALALAKSALAAASEKPSAAASPHHRRDEVTLLPPIPDPGKFLCVGKNNRNHLEELARNALLTERPKEPTGFIKLNATLVGDEAEVVRPAGISTLDYEPELTFVMARRAFGVSKADAMAYVGGITLLNDLTAREVQQREVASGTRFWTAKNMPGFGPVGPFILTLDEVPDAHDLWVTCSVNGQQRMRVHTGDMIFGIPDIIEHFSRYVPLEPGDLIATGAPAGVAVGQPNAAELYLRPGDRIEIAFEGMPGLRTTIVAPEQQGQHARRVG